jgi:hypothetical protein
LDDKPFLEVYQTTPQNTAFVYNAAWGIRWMNFFQNCLSGIFLEFQTPFMLYYQKDKCSFLGVFPNQWLTTGYKIPKLRSKRKVDPIFLPEIWFCKDFNFSRLLETDPSVIDSKYTKKSG